VTKGCLQRGRNRFGAPGRQRTSAASTRAQPTRSPGSTTRPRPRPAPAPPRPRPGAWNPALSRIPGLAEGGGAHGGRSRAGESCSGRTACSHSSRAVRGPQRRGRRRRGSPGATNQERSPRRAGRASPASRHRLRAAPAGCRGPGAPILRPATGSRGPAVRSPVRRPRAMQPPPPTPRA
jgi:hypothetical protein